MSKKKVLLLATFSSLFVLGMCFFGYKVAKSATVLPVLALESETLENPIDNIISQGESQEKEIVEKIASFKDTFLVPLLSGVSITSVISAAFAIIVAFINRKTNGKIKERTDALMDFVETTIKEVVKLVMIAKNLEGRIDEIKEELVTKTKSFEKRAIEIKEELEQLTKLKQEILMLAQIEAVSLANDTRAVAEGYAEEINKLVEEIKKLK